MRAIAFGLIFVGMIIDGASVEDPTAKTGAAISAILALVATLVCIIGGW